MKPEKLIDDMKRRLIDHQNLLTDPVRVIMQVAEDMKVELGKVNWSNRVTLNVEELKGR